jgi:hypothetical protein
VTKMVLANHEIVTVVVHLLGGESTFVDTEDIAKKANTLAPGRFTWRKYKDQINIENVRTFLKDASQEKHGGYLVGSGRNGWMLTPVGLRFAQEHRKDVVGADLSAKRLTTAQKQEAKWHERERARLLDSSAYAKMVGGNRDTLTESDVDQFFRLDDYVRGEARQTKVRRILNHFGKDPDLGAVVSELAQGVKEK